MFWRFTGRWCTTYVNCSASHLSFKSTGGGKPREEWIGTRSDVGGCHVTHELGFITSRLIRLFQWLFRRPFSRIAFLMPRSREKEREPTVWLYRLQALFFLILSLTQTLFYFLVCFSPFWKSMNCGRHFVALVKVKIEKKQKRKQVADDSFELVVLCTYIHWLMWSSDVATGLWRQWLLEVPLRNQALFSLYKFPCQLFLGSLFV